MAKPRKVRVAKLVNTIEKFKSIPRPPRPTAQQRKKFK